MENSAALRLKLNLECVPSRRKLQQQRGSKVGLWPGRMGHFDMRRVGKFFADCSVRHAPRRSLNVFGGAFAGIVKRGIVLSE